MRLALALCLLASPALAEPLLSIDITTLPGEVYDQPIAIARAAGARVTSLSLAWDELEPAGRYAPPNDWPAIANAYYPAQNVDLTLTFSVIDTTADRRPPDLRGLSWDDPALGDRFDAHLRHVLSLMPDVTLHAIAIGNEVDASLTTQTDIAAFARFLAAARQTVQTLRPGVPVATKLTATALLADRARYAPLIDAGDAVFATYYPLTASFQVRPPDAPTTDLPDLIAAAMGKPLYLLEAGYPSAGCTSTPADQTAFFSALMATWDLHKAEIPLISLSWLTDITPAETAAYSGYYGVADDCFARYLSSLGLRDAQGHPKPALTLLSKAP
jgi:hypothetical protein